MEEPPTPTIHSTRRRWLRTNRNAATLAFLTLVLLIPGLLLPFVTSTILGREQSFSVLSGIGKLHDDGKDFLAVLIFCFSVVFPLLKAFSLLLATSAFVPLGRVGRTRLAHFAITTGKYSLLDLLIVALLVVIVQLDGIAEVEPRVGTVFFGSAVLLSMLAGLCVNFPNPAKEFPSIDSAAEPSAAPPE